jgi:hypothetical protein
MIWGDGFEIETLINVRVAASGAEIAEVGSIEKERLFGESNLHAVRDGLRVLRTIMAERQRQRRVARERRRAELNARVIELPDPVLERDDSDAEDLREASA